jgi:hypothetical protein
LAHAFRVLATRGSSLFVSAQITARTKLHRQSDLPLPRNLNLNFLASGRYICYEHLHLPSTELRGLHHGASAWHCSGFTLCLSVVSAALSTICSIARLLRLVAPILLISGRNCGTSGPLHALAPGSWILSPPCRAVPSPCVMLCALFLPPLA